MSDKYTPKSFEGTIQQDYAGYYIMMKNNTVRLKISGTEIGSTLIMHDPVTNLTYTFYKKS